MKRFYAPALAIAVLFGSNLPAAAADPPLVIDWLPGEACPNFGLRAELYLDAGHLTFRSFIDKNGNVIRLLLAGQNFPITFTNLQTGASFAVKAEGAVQHIQPLSDGSTKVTLTGHAVISYTAPDSQAPATIRYVGRLVLNLDSSGSTLTIPEFTGRQTNVCAELSS